MKHVSLFLILAIFLGFIAECSAPVQPDAPAHDYWPTQDWREAPPEKQGMSPAKLAARRL